MFVVSKLKGKVTKDNTGIVYEVPILITNTGELSNLTDYILKLKRDGSSISKMNETIRVVILFVEYLFAHKDLSYNPQLIFSNFAEKLYTGTIGDDGMDPSRLYWTGHTIKTANKYLSQITDFLDWLNIEKKFEHLNPLVDANKHEERLNYAAYFKKHQYNFLGHIKRSNINETAKRVRKIKKRKVKSSRDGDTKSFPNSLFKSLIIEGFGKRKDPRVSLRDMLIVLLMHYGGLRVSEALSLWVTDVYEHYEDSIYAIVRIYDENEGIAPYDWKDRNRNRTRKAYLKQKYQRIPRIDQTGTQYLGRKVVLEDSKDGYIQVQWFPSSAGIVFMKYWKIYLKIRASIDCDHPYAFIAFEKNNIGNPYTIRAFESSYQNALIRIGHKQNADMGLTPHAHRHSYGRRLMDAQVNPTVIKKAMHHKNIESQQVYTEPNLKELSRLLDEASIQLNSGVKQELDDMSWEILTKYGFNDIDPSGLFTGTEPILKKMKR